MDSATILGLAGGILVVLQAAGDAAGLYQGTALLVVVAGGLAALLIAASLREALNVFAVVGNVFFGRKVSPLDLTRRSVGLAETARREGILALEGALAKDDDPFLTQAIQLTVDGTEPRLIMDILSTELHYTEKRHERSRELLQRLGYNWVIFGAIGALLVLVQGGGQTGGELVAPAGLPLLYGVVLYGLVGGPFARKLEAISARESLVKKMMTEAVMAIQSGDNPRIIEHKLAAFMAPKNRPRDPHPALPPPPPPPDHSRAELKKFLDEKQGLLVRLVREAVQTSAAEDAYKAQVEAAAVRLERGEISLVELLVLLGEDMRKEVLHTIQHPPPPPLEQVPRDVGFEDIGKLSDREIQMLLREVDQIDLVVALKGASDGLKEKILGNMSERVQMFINEEMSYVHAQPGRVIDAQTCILKQLFQLWREGQIELV